MDEDNKLKWIVNQIRSYFRGVKVDALNKFLTNEGTIQGAMNFINNDSQRVVYFVQLDVTKVVLQTDAPQRLSNVLYFAKVQSNERIIVGDIKNALSHLHRLTHDVYLPLFQSPEVQVGWSEVVVKEVIETMHSFLSNIQITMGQTRGETCLPLPPPDNFQKTSLLPTASGTAADTTVMGTERLHLLEGCVITWTKQIKEVLREDPENLTRRQPHPGPLMEMDFWKRKADNLNSIFSQLQTEKVRTVLKALDISKSTYSTPFAKLCQEIISAREEANANVRFLAPLQRWFDRLETAPFVELPEVFPPMMHLILAVWRASTHYNSPARLVVLLREICNALIRQACEFVSGAEVLRLVVSQETSTAITMLRTTLGVCGSFKSVYFDHKARAFSECPSNPWKLQNSAVFCRLDVFLERCHDILELTTTIQQFGHLARIEIGGTKGKTLSNSVRQIHADFQGAVNSFNEVQYDILDIDCSDFHDDFYECRFRIKELERRLNSIIAQGFDDCPTIDGRLRLLESFHALLSRPLIRDEMEKRHLVLLRAYAEDLQEVSVVLASNQAHAPVAKNLPPTAGALFWCRGLLERVRQPMLALKRIDPRLLEREDSKEVVKSFTTLVGSLGEFEQQQLTEWGSHLESSSQTKLRLPLLRQEGDLLRVNFDPALVRLLREVKYFILLNIEAPPAALQIYKKAETFRKHTGNLDLLVNMYNEVKTSMLPVEEPLLCHHMEKVDTAMAPGLKALNWKSHGIELFISECMNTMRSTHNLMDTMKTNLLQMQRHFKIWEETCLFQRQGKPLSVEEFWKYSREACSSHQTKIIEGSKQVHRLLKDTYKKLKVSAGLPSWRGYADFINNLMVMSLAKCAHLALDTLRSQLDIENIKKEDLAAMVEIDLDLQGHDVVFQPTIDHAPMGAIVTGNFAAGGTEAMGLRDLLQHIIDNFLRSAVLIKRIDGPGTFLRELHEDPATLSLFCRVEENFDLVAKDCVALNKRFKRFEHLWSKDMQYEFKQFLEESVVSSDENEPPANASDFTSHLQSSLVQLRLNRFDERVKYYRDVQDEINKIRHISDIGFLRINAQPIKQALSTWVTKWVYQFTQYLQDHARCQLTNLYNFVTTVDAALDAPVSQGDSQSLMSVMSHIRDVRKIMQPTQHMIHPLKQLEQLLKSHGMSLEGTIGSGVDSCTVGDYLERASLIWENLVNKTFKVKENIQSQQNLMADSIASDIEDFQGILSKFREEFENTAPFSSDPYDHSIQAYDSLDRFHKLVEEHQAKADRDRELEDLFELAPTRDTKLESCAEDLLRLKMIWDLRGLIGSLFNSWKRLPWKAVDAAELLDETKKLEAQLNALPEVTAEWPICQELQMKLKQMMVVLPLIDELHAPGMGDRHWKSLMMITGGSLPSDIGAMQLKQVMDLRLHEHVPDVQDIIQQARRDQKIAQRLSEIESMWSDQELVFEPFHHDLKVLLTPTEALEGLEEQQLQLQSVACLGKAAQYFMDRIKHWQATLSQVETVLHIWLSVQRQWRSLESIFLASDIREQLPDDAKRFEGADVSFRDILENARNIPHIVNACTMPGRLEILQDIQADLEICQRNLNEYLDVKKKIFPRFYFMNNNALLHVLSNGSNPPAIQTHLSDCFASIESFQFADKSRTDEDGNAIPATAISGFVGTEGEVLELVEVCDAQGPVENWLNKFSDATKKCLDNLLEAALDAASSWEVDRPRHQWLFLYPAQIILLAAHIFWTEETEVALNDLEQGQDDALQIQKATLQARLDDLIRLALGSLADEDRVKVITLITNDVHQRDVVSRMIEDKVQSPDEFGWQSQLRCYWTAEGGKETICRICDFKTWYGFEYIGNCSRLVITPLTDRCYITLSLALRLNLGGAPAGPAGTGKTETTKDLSRNLGLCCYVFNCSDQMNYQTLASIFKGLAQLGAWGCFDEFNRISVEVLSVVASQVRSVLDAVRLYCSPSRRIFAAKKWPAGRPPVKVGSFVLQGDEITLVPTVGLFITMNPGYAGRSELPENVKVLFRPCSMVRPDLKYICENVLMSEGFLYARPLAAKFICLYSLASQMLSQQHHYDWGLRAVKSVLTMAGRLRRRDPEVPEQTVLCRALRDFNVPKIVSCDTPVFLRLVSDLFPSVNAPPATDKLLQNTIIKACGDLSLQAEESFVLKVTQLAELLQVRHSVMILGPAGCGKTSAWKTLSAAVNMDLPKPTCVSEVISPKTLSPDELYGKMSLTKEWTDGALAHVMRSMSQHTGPYTDQQTNKWIILDGDVDAVWIESMNTVMDDNKLLTLVSSERITLRDDMRLMFEIDSLANATPATVSRAGILVLEESDVGWTAVWESWVAKQSGKTRALLPNLVQKYIPEGLLIFNECKTKSRGFAQSDVSVIINTCGLLEAMLKGAGQSADESDKLEGLLISAFLWASAGSLSGDVVAAFTEKWKSRISDSRLPVSQNVLDYFYDAKHGQFKSWADELPSLPVSHNPNRMFVPTSNLARIWRILHLLCLNKSSADENNTQGQVPMLIGPNGVGKTTLVKEFQASLAEPQFGMDHISFHALLKADSLQKLLERGLEKRSGRVYGPPSNGQLLVFVDDVNVCYREEYDTQPALELLRRLIGQGSWLGRKDLSLKMIVQDVLLIASAGSKQTASNFNRRLMRHFLPIHMSMPSTEVCNTMFKAVVHTHFSSAHQASNLMPTLTRCVEAFIEVCNAVIDKFLPAVGKHHYEWNLRELAKCTASICQLSTEHVQNPIGVVQLWLHESQRVFGDKMATPKDQTRFQDLLSHECKKHFAEFIGEQELEGIAIGSSSIFTRFATPTLGDKNAYLPAKSHASLKEILEDKLQHYNEAHSIMELVMFESAMSHICRCARILSQPSGHLLLIGVGGSGKQSALRLGSFVSGLELMELNSGGDGNMDMVMEQIKELFYRAAVKPAVPTIMLISDTQMPSDDVLIPINTLLSQGFVDWIFTVEELDQLLAALRPAAKANGVGDSMPSLLAFLRQRVIANVRLALCMSPVGPAFARRCANFPGILTACNIDFFHPWTKDALVSVSNSLLSKSFEDLKVTPEIKDNICQHMGEVHISVEEANNTLQTKYHRTNYSTPKLFLEYISFYEHLLQRQGGVLKAQIARLCSGLDRLERTGKDVAQLQEELRGTLKRVEEKKAGSEELLEQMGQQQGEAEVQRALATSEQAAADVAAKTATEIEQQANTELQEAKPALEKASDAVKCLNKASLTELKSLSKPPMGVDKVTTAVLMMVKQEKHNFQWDNAKKMMSKVDAFKISLEKYDAENIPAEVLHRLKPIVSDPLFTPEKMMSKSHAAANLCTWVVCTLQYNTIFTKVKPLMARLNGAQKAKMEADQRLALADGKVQEVADKLAALQANFLRVTNEKAIVEAEAASYQSRLALAERLVGGLSDEKERWSVEVDSLNEKEECLVGDVLLSASFLSYLGPFPSAMRETLWKDGWLPDILAREIPLTPDCSPVSTIASESDISQFHSQGLPQDGCSLENALVVSTATTRCPLLVDPQQQGLSWLKRHLKVSGEETIQLSFDSPWIRAVAVALQRGQSVLISGAGDQLDPRLMPILEKRLVRKGRNLFISFGGQEIDYNPNFKLYLQTRAENPKYSPEVTAQCVMVNFIVTASGLEEQLLANIVSRKKPELEQRKQELQQEFTEFKIQIHDLESDLLMKLANAPDDILGASDLVEDLEAIKLKALEINNAVETSKTTESVINEARDVYRALAHEGSNMFFLLQRLSSINHMYQFSLHVFLMFFTHALQTTPSSDDELQHVEALIQACRFEIYQWASRGLSERHKLMLLSEITIELLLSESLENECGFSREHLHFLLHCPVAATDSEIDWLTNTQWGSIEALSSIEGFDRLAVDFQESSPRFREWFQHPYPETQRLPLDYRELDKLYFRKLLVLRCLRPDRLEAALSAFVAQTLPEASKYINCDMGRSFQGVLKDVLETSHTSTPVFFSLSPGVDIVADVSALAKARGLERGKSFHEISLGQGQEMSAKMTLMKAMTEGHWVLLNNLHLMPTFCKEIERLVMTMMNSATGNAPTRKQRNSTLFRKNSTGRVDLASLAMMNVSKDFRLFLSSNPSSLIPDALLGHSIRLSNEAPTGLKANVKKAWCLFSSETVADLSNRNRTVLFALCYFHAVVTERQRFGPIGFNKQYPFSEGDLLAAFDVMKAYMEDCPSVPWKDIKFLFGDILYGGHITNDADRRIANEYLNCWLHDELFENELQLFPFLSTLEYAQLDGFMVPTKSTHAEILNDIDERLEDSAAAFGLHPNAEIGFRTLLSTELFSNLKNISPLTGSEGPQRQTKHVVEATLQDTLELLRDAHLDINSAIADINDLDPIQTVFVQECHDMNKLLVEVTGSLTKLERGLAGREPVDNEMEQITEALYNGEVPSSWKRYSFASSRPLAAWLQSLQSRLDQLQTWLLDPMVPPFSIWIGGLFNPRALLTAASQIVIRQTKAPLDSMGIVFEVTKRQPEDISAMPREGIYIHGLYLDGASWSDSMSTLEDSGPRELHKKMPVIHVKPVPLDKIRQVSTVELPVYQTPARADTHVFDMHLRTKVAAAKWVLTGAALLLDVL